MANDPAATQTTHTSDQRKRVPCCHVVESFNAHAGKAGDAPFEGPRVGFHRKRVVRCLLAPLTVREP